MSTLNCGAHASNFKPCQGVGDNASKQLVLLLLLTMAERLFLLSVCCKAAPPLAACTATHLLISSLFVSPCLLKAQREGRDATLYCARAGLRGVRLVHTLTCRTTGWPSCDLCPSPNRVVELNRRGSIACILATKKRHKQCRAFPTHGKKPWTGLLIAECPAERPSATSQTNASRRSRAAFAEG